MPEESQDICMFFVDDSNIWIEAQKFAASGNSHMPKLTDRDRDPRLRINIGKLVKTLLRGRFQGTSYLYDSRPPPNDAVWNTFEKYKFDTKIYDRARGKEKQVDSAMAADLSGESAELSTGAKFDSEIKEKNKRTVFIAITGDQDMVPPIRRVLGYGFRVELWAWKSGLSAEYLKLANDMSLLSINYLENVFKEISFTSYRSTRRSGKVNPSCTLVLCEFTGSESTNPDAEAIVCDGLDGWGRLSFITPSNMRNEFYVEFPGVKSIDDIDSLMVKAKTQFGGLWKIMSWLEYANRFNEGPPAMVETSNMFAPLEGDGDAKSLEMMVKGESQPIRHSVNAVANVRDTSNPWKLPIGGEKSENAEASSLDDSNNNKWETVSRYNLKRGHHAKQPCPYGIRCGKRGDCGHIHTTEEHDLFQALPEQNFKKWRTSKCRYGDRCYLGKRCAFYHTPAEAWCTRCLVEGHCREDCKY
ncbi:hypothetical protein CEP52_012531 [Fusarium oligoseptatum]|uniref:NYN domain-containing protein n=1 Tax=Fusarium oligoseptatum TaxID=2604345 RepID=A0A428SXW1_9HYPO|nr:hypothetical protein CEP52_012531 [Fusarium oligoseptatum]